MRCTVLDPCSTRATRSFFALRYESATRFALLQLVLSAPHTTRGRKRFCFSVPFAIEGGDEEFAFEGMKLFMEQNL